MNNLILNKNLKSGMILKTISEKNINKYWVILNVNIKDIKNGIDAEYPGLYAFTDIIGDDPLNISSYNKMISTDNQTFELICNDIKKYNLKKIKSLLSQI